MSKIIASTYELIETEKIGSGGGGNIYLAKHLRLGKKVVLKADKRKITTRQEFLRREVDVLKELNHPYIPRVYDFFMEDETVYTVMDYIEGESLDKPLKRGERYPQAQVIKWAKQLLEALSYLHSPTHGEQARGYVHSDIKPANLMRTPDNNICLIDFNIALALGEENFIGCSAGYASPEHYGLDFSSDEYATTRGRGRTRAGTAVRSRGKSGTATVAPPEFPGRGTGTVMLPEAFGKGTETATMPDAPGKGTETVTLSEVSVEGVETITLPEAPEKGTETVKLVSARRLEESKKAMNTPASEPSGGSSASGRGSTSGSSKMKVVVPDVRSDIYSVGATLYHLLSGRRPERNAMEVTPLSEEEFSPQIVMIIAKAMNPNPDFRYQTADEMLEALQRLWDNDIRTRRLKRSRRIAFSFFSFVFAVSVGMSFVGLKRMQMTEGYLKLAEYSSNALAEGDVSSAIQLALQAIPEEDSLLQPPVAAQVRLALTEALGVYDLSDGFKALDALELPSAPFGIAVSPEGTYVAVVYAYETAVYDMSTQQKITTLPMQESALSDVVFVDEERLVYAGAQGVSAYDMKEQTMLWTRDAATNLALSADGSTVAAVDRDEEFVKLYRVSDGAEVVERSFEGLHLSVAVNDIFADPGDDIFALNEDGSLLAVSFSNGGLMILDLENPEEDIIIYEESEYRHFEGGFCGRYFAFAIGKSGEFQFGLIDVPEALYIGGYASQDAILLHADAGGIYTASRNLLVRVEPDTLEEVELSYTGNVNITAFSVGKEYVLAATDDNSFSFYDRGANLASTVSCDEKCVFTALTERYAILGNRDEPSLRLLELENHGDAQLLSYDPRYEHDEARISEDGKRAMLFSYQDFRVYDMDGRVLGEGKFPEADSIYDQQFRKSEEGSWLEVIWYDGTVRCYSAEDGSVISEETREAPAKDLYEEFYIDGYRVVSPLHGVPEVYSLQTDRLTATLEEDSYLTYVTQMGKYIVTEYISAEGERYGILLNYKFEKLAYLPRLCDIMGDKLVFDYGSGDLRQCSIYSLEELVALGEAFLEDK